jgi:hypothetical protein
MKILIPSNEQEAEEVFQPMLDKLEFYKPIPMLFNKNIKLPSNL